MHAQMHAHMHKTVEHTQYRQSIQIPGEKRWVLRADLNDAMEEEYQRLPNIFIQRKFGLGAETNSEAVLEDEFLKPVHSVSEW